MVRFKVRIGARYRRSRLAETGLVRVEPMASR